MSCQKLYVLHCIGSHWSIRVSQKEVKVAIVLEYTVCLLCGVIGLWRGIRGGITKCVNNNSSPSTVKGRLGHFDSR